MTWRENWRFESLGGFLKVKSEANHGDHGAEEETEGTLPAGWVWGGGTGGASLRGRNYWVAGSSISRRET